MRCAGGAREVGVNPAGSANVLAVLADPKPIGPVDCPSTGCRSHWGLWAVPSKMLQHGQEEEVPKTAEVGVHDVDRHLHGIEMEIVRFGDFQHAQVYERVFMAGKADEADSPAFRAPLRQSEQLSMKVMPRSF
jgi:hypothetical protein